MVFCEEYQIALGYDNVPGLTPLEEIIPLGDVPFMPVSAYGGFDPGVLKILGDGLDYYSGFPSQRWIIAVVTVEQDYHIRDQIFGNSGVWSGLVTFRTDLIREGEWGNYNAVLSIGKPTVWRIRRIYIPDYTMLFRRIRPVSP